MKKTIFIGLMVAIFGVIYALSLNMIYQRGYETGRDEGWQGCIEENNLYDRYN